MNDLGKSIGGIIFILVIIGLAVFLLWFFIFKVKHLKTPDVYMVDGGVKTGKSLVTTMLAIKQYRKNIVKVLIVNCFIKIINFFRKLGRYRKPPMKLRERPMLYSNMPLYHVKYNQLTMDILMWKVRIPHKSVVLIDEASLLADSMTGFMNNRDKKDKEKFDEINETLTLFIKTFGHQTHGGSLFYSTHDISDLHFSFKRCTTNHLFISKNRKYPFFMLLDVRELVHDESHDTININNGDVDDDNKPLFVSKRWFKYYDRFYLDVLTKHLKESVDYSVEKLDHKHKKELEHILTMGSYKKIKEYNETQDKLRGSNHAKA